MEYKDDGDYRLDIPVWFAMALLSIAVVLAYGFIGVGIGGP